MQQTIAAPVFSKPLRAAAQAVSYIIHPVFIPAAITYVLLFLQPINVLLVPGDLRIRIMAMVVLNTLFFPTLTMVLLWRLKFIKNLYMEDMKERIIPLNVTIIFYFWAFYVGRNVEAIPPSLQQWLLGVFLGSCAAMFINIWKKVSLHSIGVGGLLVFCAWQQAVDPYFPAGLFIVSVLIAGLVGTSRLIRNAHEPSEIYLGYVVGGVCQLAGSYILS